MVMLLLLFCPRNLPFKVGVKIGSVIDEMLLLLLLLLFLFPERPEKVDDKMKRMKIFKMMHLNLGVKYISGVKSCWLISGLTSLVILIRLEKNKFLS